MTARQHIAAALLAIATANWHALHARYQPSRLADFRQCGEVAIRQLRRALELGGAM